MAKNNSAISFRELLSDIQNGIFAPIYILMGDEDYYIDRLVDALETSVVGEEEKDFNVETFYGADTDIKKVIARAQQYPVMAERQLVMLKEAQALYNGKRELEKLAPYASHPNPSTILVVTYKGDSLNNSSVLLKKIKDNRGVILKSERPKDYELNDLVSLYCKENDIKIQPKTINLLCEYIGSPLSKLFGEIDKLTVAAGAPKIITPELVESIIGISKDFNSFELVKAISIKNYYSAFQIISHFTKNPKQNPGVVIIATLFNYFSKLFIASILKDKSDFSLMNNLELKSSYALTDYKNGLRNFNPSQIDNIIHTIRETDAKSKGIGSTSNEFDLIKDLIFKIFYVA